MSKIRAIVFDMDGVLVDARDWHYESLNRALGLFGYQIGRYEHLTVFDGLPTRTKLEMLSTERGLPRGLHSFINEMKQSYLVETVHTTCRPTFAHEYALSRLHADNYILAVASNSIRATIDLMMGKCRLSEYLDLVLSNEDVAKAKPDPEIYIKAMRLLKVQPHECLIVEDNEHGLQAARASGAHVLAVTNPGDVTYSALSQRIEKAEMQQ